jgi:hypothetical protein
VQATPQAPQFVALVLRSAQIPAQSVVPVGHAQLPFEQTRLPKQTCEQKPQLVLSVRRSTHAFPHFASPEPQLFWQFPVLHTCPFMQRLPHEPQLLGLHWRSTHTAIRPEPHVV